MMAESKTSQLVVLQGPQELILLRMDWRVPRRQSKFRKAVLSDVQAFYSWSRKQTIKGGSVLRLRAMLLFSQAVNSTFEAGVEGFIRCDFPHVDGARTHIDAIMRKLAP
jgi:hypothetical protein